MKKAEILQDLAVYMRDRVDNGFDITITDAEALALVEALESLRWVNFYKNPDDTTVIGCEYSTKEEAEMIGDSSPSIIGYLETVGIIRLKDSQDEN